MNIELLAPAGSLEKLKYAFAYGADAVYAGVPMFALRARENKFSINEVQEAVAYTRKLGKKIYLTTNIYAHNIKIEPFLEAFDEMVKLKPDAFIMADPGLIMLVREKYPDIEIHLSTQASVVNWAQVKFWHESLNLKRIILARELSLHEIKEIHQKLPDIELEAFVHGSMCIAYSGRCLLSNYFAGRDSNQGICAHSCRWQYQLYEEKGENSYLRSGYEGIKGNYYLEEKERLGELLPIDEDEHGTYIMNSRDLCTLAYLPEILESGLVSLKIEGRNKTLHYLATVVGVYRKALDQLAVGKKIDPNLIDELAAVSNRGFIPGFYVGNQKELAQNYNCLSYQTRQFIGIVRKFDKSNMTVELEMKNRMDKGDELELMSPDGIFSQKLSEMWYSDDLEQKLLEVAHGGHKNVVFRVDKVVSEFGLVRKKII